MTRAKGKAIAKAAAVQYREPGEAKGVLDLDKLTCAEMAKELEIRLDEHMIYEMYHVSQYRDGSVLDCLRMRTFTAEELTTNALTSMVAVFGDQEPAASVEPSIAKLGREVAKDIRRNAMAAVKNGTTTNLAPRVSR